MFFDLATAPFPPVAEVTAAIERWDTNPPATLLGLPVVHDPALPPKPERTPSLATRLAILTGDNPPKRKRPFRNQYPPEPAHLSRRQRKQLRRLLRHHREFDGPQLVADLREWGQRCCGGDAIRSGSNRPPVVMQPEAPAGASRAVPPVVAQP